MMIAGIEEFERYGRSKQVQAAMRRAYIEAEGAYTEFMDQLYADVDRIIYGLQSSRHGLQEDCEDRLTEEILRSLKQLGYSTTHDNKNGGHVDFSVLLGEHCWMAEAKKDGDYKEGLLQLTTRYVQQSGNYKHDAAGLLFYLVKTQNAKGVLDRWKADLAAKQIKHSDCANNVLAMYSEHSLDGSGTKLNVRTMVVALFHDPKDRSGRA